MSFRHVVLKTFYTEIVELSIDPFLQNILTKQIIGSRICAKHRNLLDEYPRKRG